MVTVAPVDARDLTRSSNFIGHVEAIREVDIKARVEGFLESVEFKEGGVVEAGQVLFRIESAPYEAELAAARASLAMGQAQLSAARAALTQAQQDVDRQTTLVERETSPQAVLDQAIARRDEAEAQVHSAEAEIARANANIQTVELHLSYTEIVSPIDGRIGRANFTDGNLVSPQSGTLASVVQRDPVRVRFSISSREYVDLLEAHLGETDEEIMSALIPMLRLPDGREYEYSGHIDFADNRVDPSTGTMAVRAEFPNPGSLLVPGQFVGVTVAEGETHHVAVVPAGAILQDREGPYVLALDDDNRATIRRVEMGERMADEVVVTNGLLEGEIIVIGGLQRVHPGQIVSPHRADAGI